MDNQCTDCSKWPTIAALTDHLTEVQSRGGSDADLQELMRCMPEWATFHEARSALGVAGFELALVRRVAQTRGTVGGPPPQH